MNSRGPEENKPTSNRPRTSAMGVAAGAAVGGVLVAGGVAGVHDAIALAGIGYLVYLGSYHAAKHVGARRRQISDTAMKAGDADLFSAFLDALHDQS